MHVTWTWLLEPLFRGGTLPGHSRPPRLAMRGLHAPVGTPPNHVPVGQPCTIGQEPRAVELGDLGYGMKVGEPHVPDPVPSANQKKEEKPLASSNANQRVEQVAISCIRV